MSSDVYSEGGLNGSSFGLYKSFTVTSIVVCGLLMMVGTLQFSLPLRSDDPIAGFSYFELAKSIIETGFYGIDSKPQTNFPPGFPLILASLCMTVGCKPVVFIRSMSVFATLGFIVSYELLRRLQDRVVAAVSCVLLTTSPIFFILATRA